MGHIKPQDPAFAEAKRVWKIFSERDKARQSKEEGFWVKGSLTYTSSGRTSRVIVEMWGDNELPARLNVTSPMGVALLLCREDRNEFIAFAPDREEAWRFKSAAEGLSALGMASAFSLPVLAKMSFGVIDKTLLPDDFESARAVSGKGFEYYFADNSRTGSIILDNNGRPLKIIGKPGDRFVVTFADYSRGDDRDEPNKITFEGRKTTAEIIVRDRELRDDRWPARSLKMDIPEGVTLKTIK